MPKKKKYNLNFNVGDTVVYPSHGVGQINSIEKIQIGEVKSIVDVIQIPAFLCRQTDLIVEACKTDCIVNIKKGQFCSAESVKFMIEKVTSQGNEKVIVTERGNSFGYQDLVVDMRNIPIMKAFGKNIVLDVTHSLQRPNQGHGVSGGTPEFIETIACAGIATKVNGIFLETHPNPKNALSDGSTMLPLGKLESLLLKLKSIRKAVI